MTAFLGTDFNDLAKLLFRCLSTTNADFNPLKYLDNFESFETNLEKVNFVYNDLKKYPNVFAKFIKDAKDDTTAIQHADTGNKKSDVGNYWEALEDHTRTLASAASDRVRALAYANRSECFFKLNMAQKCIEDIDRALKLDYLQDLKENLIERRKQAEELELFVKKYYEVVPTVESNESERNVCVKIGDHGTYIVATRDIEIGEIISLEEPFTCVLTSDRQKHCHNCLNLCYNLIPCKNCTVALFCSETCKASAQAYHKYECPILLTICYRALCEFATDDSMLLALKVALLAKDNYPLLKYSSKRNNEMNTIELLTNFSRFDLFHQSILTAVVFELLWNYTSFFSGIFSNSNSQDRFKEVMLSQLQCSSLNAAKIYEYVEKIDFGGTNNFGYGAYPFFSSFTHSCCANVMKTYHGSTMVLRALNTVKEGEQCFVNRYGLRYDASTKFERQQFLFNHKLPKCGCKACENDWNPGLGEVAQICELLDIEAMELGDIVKKVIGADVEKAKSFLLRLIPLLKECESLEPTGNALALKSLIAHCYVIFGNKKLEFSDVKKDVVFPL